MPTVQDQDLNYQPTTNPYSYSSPKVSIFKKIFNFLKNIFSIKTLFTESKLFFIIIIPFILFVFALIIINYFNVLSLSYLYPKYFSLLPHRYDAVANKAALAGVPNIADSNEQQIDGKLYQIKKETILIEYNGKVAEFILSDKLSCSTQITKKITKTVEETSYDAAFCSDILSSENIGKKASVTYLRTASGLNIINNITIE